MSLVYFWWDSWPAFMSFVFHNLCSCTFFFFLTHSCGMLSNMFQLEHRPDFTFVHAFGWYDLNKEKRIAKEHVLFQVSLHCLWYSLSLSHTYTHTHTHTHTHTPRQLWYSLINFIHNSPMHNVSISCAIKIQWFTSTWKLPSASSTGSWWWPWPF